MTLVDDQSLILGDSPPIRRLKALIARVAPSDQPVLIQGPTGAGKELVALALHRASGRSGRLVAFNVCAVPDTVLEDTLFGHVRGAFTGARDDAPGYLAQADRGTVFFDEIGGLPWTLQSKLLRAVETREFRPVGARSDRYSDFRVISATNEALDALVDVGRFRADLAFRLRGVVLTVPALRDRKEDIPVLVRRFVADAGKTGASEPRIDDAALGLLMDYDWPGNVRELRNVVTSAVVLAEESKLSRSDLAAVLEQRSDPLASEGRDFARRRLLGVLDQTAWDTSVAAHLLGVHRGTVYRRMQRLGIPVPRRRPENGFASVRANSHEFAANRPE